MGGLDIFRAQKTKMGKWEVTNMLYPLNSTADDFGIVFQTGMEKGMFTSSRRKGNDDIYRFELMPIIFTYNGIVKNFDTGAPLQGVIINVISSKGEQKKIMSDPKGRFNLKLDAGTEYIFVAGHDSFLNAKDQVSTVNLEESKTFTGLLELKPFEKPIELPNILYDFGSWELREVSKTALDGLVETLNDNPNITIELGSHTDLVGSEKSNQELSQKRAQSVVDYLIEKGIYWDRLEAKGYGESSPKIVGEQLAEEYEFLNEGDILEEAFISKLSTRDQEVANQINRRTEFQVLSTDYKPGPNSKRKPGAEHQKLRKTLIKDLSSIEGVFYTVQLGIYDKSNIPVMLEQFPVVFRSEADSKSYRYTFGIFDHYDEARAEAQKISGKGIKAFVIAYNNGKKITFEEAKKLKQ
jgi:peptidoglycan-associated lipoprotein